ncbi:MAG: tyrosine-type recombinase/integrase [Idiomarina sp.]|nr:tyrosine-type recombinase/integrase [Idiomarina sp.]
MRFKIIDNETVDLSKSHVLGQSELKEDIVLSQKKTRAVVAFNKNHEVLPLVSDWLTEELSEKLTPPSTIGTYANNISYFLDYLNEAQSYENLAVDDAFLHIYSHTIQEYFAYLKTECSLSSNTIRNRDATFQIFFDKYLCRARRDGKAIRDDNPYDDGLLSRAAKSKVVEMCTLNELKALILCSHSERERAMIQFMYDTGVRRSEVTKVKKTDIDKAFNSNKSTLIVDQETVALPSKYKALYVAGSKGRKREVKPRYTLPSSATLARVRRYFSTPEYRKLAGKYGLDARAFINSEGRPYTQASIGKILKKLSDRAIKRGLLERPIHPHMLRHGFAGGVLRSPDLGEHSVDKLVVLQQCLGHSHIATTQIYTALPYDIYGQYQDNNSVLLTRADLMERLSKSTRLTVPLKEKR